MPATNLMYNNIHFDSDEEVFVAMWLEELKIKKLITSWKRVSKPISLTDGLKLSYIKETKLKTKIKREVKEHILLRPSEYTADFQVIFTLKAFEKNIVGEILENYHDDAIKDIILWDSRDFTYLEVKPAFDQQNMERLFKNNQKFIWDKYQIFVNLIEPLALFQKTFLPSAAEPYFRYKKLPKKAAAKGKRIDDFKFDFIPLTIEEFLDGKERSV